MIPNTAEAIQYPLKNDLMFALVMNDANLCKGLLERILPDRKIRSAELYGSNVEIQKTIVTGLVSKSVRLDVLFEGDDTIYDIELQACDDPALPLRGRYYGSAMDIDQIRRGVSYSRLKQSFVIFICTFDHYGLGQAVYSFQNYDCKNNLSYGDGSYKIIVNTAAPEESTPSALSPFFSYMRGMEVPEDDGFIGALHDRVVRYNTSEWRRELMTLEEKKSNEDLDHGPDESLHGFHSFLKQ